MSDKSIGTLEFTGYRCTRVESEWEVYDVHCGAPMRPTTGFEDDLLDQIAELEAARFAYASEFPRDTSGDPDVGSIHANIRALKKQLHDALAQGDKDHEELNRKDRQIEDLTSRLKALQEVTFIVTDALRLIGEGKPVPFKYMSDQIRRLSDRL